MSEEKTEKCPPPSPPPPSLNDLPRELVSEVTSYLEGPDAVTLLHTSTLLNCLIKDKQIWPNISLTVPRNFGELPLVQPHAEDGESLAEYKVWASQQKRDAYIWREQHLKAKVNGVLFAGNAARWAMVKSLTFEHRPITTIGMTQILEFVQPSLRSLVMLGAGPDHHPTQWENISYRSLDANILDGKLCFPSLESVRLGPAALVHISLIDGGSFALWAPNATSADTDLSRYANGGMRGGARLGGDLSSRLSAKAGDTKLVKLRVKLSDERETGDPDLVSIMAITWLLQASPRLRQFSVSYTGKHMHVIPQILRTLPRCRYLEDLHLDGCVEVHELETFWDVSLANLKRLVVKVDWATMVDLSVSTPLFHADIQARCIIGLPNAHKIYLDGCQSNADLSFIPTNPDIRGGWDQQFRGSPHLRVYHTLQHVIDHDDIHLFDRLDEVEQTADLGRVYSFVHGDEEVIYSRVLTDYVRATNGLPPSDCASPLQQVCIKFAVAEEEPYERSYIRPAQPFWRAYSDYKELVVPLKVIDQVWAVHGAGVRERRGRGIKVGDAAWKVLTDWYEGEVAHRAKEESAVVEGESAAAEEAVVTGESAASLSA